MEQKIGRIFCRTLVYPILSEPYWIGLDWIGLDSHVNLYPSDSESRKAQSAYLCCQAYIYYDIKCNYPSRPS